MKKQQSGFTLIELIAVIVILGALAVVALPRFIDLSAQADAAALEGVVGGASSASALNYAAALAGSTDTATFTDCDQWGDILLDGAPNGYTVASNSLGAALGDSATCTITQTSSSDTADFTGFYVP